MFVLKLSLTALFICKKTSTTATKSPRTIAVADLKNGVNISSNMARPLIQSSVSHHSCEVIDLSVFSVCNYSWPVHKSHAWLQSRIALLFCNGNVHIRQSIHISNSRNKLPIQMIV